MGEYRSKFKLIQYTKHVIKDGESKGKASNVSWCVEHMKEEFIALSIDPKTVLITVMDSDSWAPELYFSEIESYVRAH